MRRRGLLEAGAARLLLAAVACALLIAGALAEGAAGLTPRPGCHRACAPKELTGVPSSCRSNAFVAQFHLAHRRSVRLRFYLDDRLVRSTTEKDFDVTVDCARLRSGRHQIEVTGAYRSGPGRRSSRRSVAGTAFTVR
jgi:hypothetical protein